MDALDAYLSAPDTKASPKVDALDAYLNESAPASNGSPTSEPTDTASAKAYVQSRVKGLLNSGGMLPPNPTAEAGFNQGVEDVVASFDPLASKLNALVPSVGRLGTALGLPSVDAAHAQHVSDRNAFNQQYGDDAEANLYRAGGNIAASVPVFAAGGSVAKAATAIPEVGELVTTLGNLLNRSKTAKYAAQAVNGAGQGATGNLLISSQSDEPIPDQMREGGIVGAAVGPTAQAISSTGRGIANLLTGGGVNPKVAELAQVAQEKYGIPVRGGQISESPFVKYMDSTLSKIPFTGYAEKDEAARGAFARAVSNTFGEDSTSLSPEVLSSARKRIGSVFNDVANRTSISAEPVVNSLAEIEASSPQVLADSEYAPIKKQMENVLSKIGDDGTISGEAYQAITRRGSPLDRLINNSQDSNVRHFAGDIKDALDNALIASAAPEDVSALKTAKLQYKNLMTVKDIATKADAEGEISPALLLNAVRKSYKNMPFTGAGDIGEIARIGQQFLKPQPSSGTGERLAALQTLHSIGHGLTSGLAKTIAGGTVGMAAYTNPIPTAVTLGGLLGAARITGKVLDSQWYKNRLLQSLAEHPEAESQLPPAVLESLRRYAIPATVIGVNRSEQPTTSQVNP